MRGEPDVSPVLGCIIPAGQDCPPGLREVLERGASIVFEAQLAAEAMPRRADLRDVLNAIEKHAMAIRSLVIQVSHVAPELHYAFGDKENPDVPGAMERLVRLARAKAASIPTGAGRHVAGPSLGRPGGRRLCALIIINVWRHVRLRPPDPNNGNAQDACAALWEAAYQKPITLSGSTTNIGWQRHLEDARCIDRGRPDFPPGPTPQQAALKAMIARMADSIWAKPRTE